MDIHLKLMNISGKAIASHASLKNEFHLALGKASKASIANEYVISKR